MSQEEGRRGRHLLVRQGQYDYLRGYFCAAALARYDLRTVAAWVAGADPDVPERILLAAGASQWAHTLAELRSRSPQDRSDSADGGA